MDRLERAIGLGTSDDPRKIQVGRRTARIVRPVVSTPGARVRLSRTGWDGELTRVLVALHRRGVPVELVEGPDALTLDGRPIAPDALLRAI